MIQQSCQPAALPLSHVATALVDAPADAVFDFLADPVALGEWSLGCMRTQPAGLPGIYTGWSLFDGSQAWFEIVADARLLLVDYHVGSMARRTPRIAARVVRGSVCGLSDDQCYATLTAWRPQGMAPERWARLCSAHETEIWLIKEQIEAKRRPASG
jgi:hypothetical protein